MRNAEEAAAARAAEMLGDMGVESPDSESNVEAGEQEAEADMALASVSSSEPEPVAEAEEAQHETEEEEAFELPNLDPPLPEDIKEELEMDWEDEEEIEDPAPGRDEEEDEWDDEDDDPRVAALKRKLAQAEKKAKWAETKRAEAKRERWEAEALKYFPLSAHAVGEIRATSRRGFLREARKAHDSLKPMVNKIAQQYQDTIAAAKAKALEEAKQEADAAWGKPTVAPGGRENTTEAEKRERIANARNLDERIKARLGF